MNWAWLPAGREPQRAHLYWKWQEMAFTTRKLVVVKADKSLTASFSAAGRGNPPPDGTSAAVSDFVCEVFSRGRCRPREVAVLRLESLEVRR